MIDTTFSNSSITEAKCFRASIKMQFALSALIYADMYFLRSKSKPTFTVGIVNLPKAIYEDMIKAFERIFTFDRGISVRDIFRYDAEKSDYKIDFGGRNTKRLFGQIRRLAERDTDCSELYSVIEELASTDNSRSICKAEQSLKSIIADRYLGVDEDKLIYTEYLLKQYRQFIGMTAELSICAERLSDFFGIHFDIDEFLINGIINMLVNHLTTNYKNRAVTEMYFIISFLLNNTNVQIQNDKEPQKDTADIIICQNGKFKNTVSVHINVQFINSLDENQKALIKPLLMNLIERRQGSKIPKHQYRLIIDKDDFSRIFKPLMNGGYRDNAALIRDRNEILPRMALISRIGGKKELSYGLSRLFENISDKSTSLITCCGGGARELDYVIPLNYKEIIYNDKVTSICALFKAVSDERLTDMLRTELEKICSDYDEIINSTFEKAKNMYRRSADINSLNDDELIDFALNGFVVCNCAYNGIEGKRGFNEEHTSPNYQKLKKRFINKCKSLTLLHSKYKGIKVLNEDIFVVLEKYRYDKNAVIYIDPPYPLGKNNDPCDYYINRIDIAELVSVLSDNQTQAKIIISGMSNNKILYSDLVKNGWHQYYVKTIQISTSFEGKVHNVDEYIWTNFGIENQLLCDMALN